MGTAQEAAAATALWWADKVFGGAVGRNDVPGSTDSHASTAMMLGILAGRQGVPADAGLREQFEARLARYVYEQLELALRPRWSVTLATDYGPEGFLATLAREFGIGGSFPWKTVTWTYSDHLVTSLGYGTPHTLAWTADDYVRPPCGQGQWSDSPTDFERLPWKCSAPIYHSGGHVFDAPDSLCQAADPHREGRLCLRREDDEYHRSDLEYMSQWAHQFQGAVQ